MGISSSSSIVGHFLGGPHMFAPWGSIFITVLFIAAKEWKPPTSPSRGDWWKKPGTYIQWNTAQLLKKKMREHLQEGRGWRLQNHTHMETHLSWSLILFVRILPVECLKREVGWPSDCTRLAGIANQLLQALKIKTILNSCPFPPNPPKKMLSWSPSEYRKWKWRAGLLCYLIV